MLPGERRRFRSSSGVNGVTPGSIWEARMKMDEVKGGIKVFNGDTAVHDDNDEDGVRVYRRLTGHEGNSSTDTVVSSCPAPAAAPERKKRRSWRPPEPPAVVYAAAKLEADDGGEEEDGFDDKEIVAEGDKNTTEEKETLIIDETMDLDQQKEMMQAGSETEETHEIPQSIVDLIMWRNKSKTALVLGCGSFLLLSSSCIEDFDFSLLTAISYLGLVYLALLFIYKSIFGRREVGIGGREEERSFIGEDEAICAVRFVLPYINEAMMKIKALLSGDPLTTMKMAVLLLAVARCGSSITIWTLAKLLFLGLFTIPKLMSSYSVQLESYGDLLERLRDGWESCGHKKAIAAATFTLIWYISSTVVRIWSVFMLLVAVKLYQESRMQLEGDEQLQEEEEEEREKKVIEAKRQGNSIPAAELRPAGSNKNYRLRPQRVSGPRPTVGKEREATKMKKWM